LVTYVVRLPELDAFARFLASGNSRSNFSMWTTFTQLCGAHHVAHVGPVVVEPELIHQASLTLREHYFREVPV
jgi:hypothetical protein